MNSLEIKSGKVFEVYRDIDEDTMRFICTTGMHCKQRCDHCCEKQNLETSILELLPLAFYFEQQGLIDFWLDSAQHYQENPFCMFHSMEPTPLNGFCKIYEFRPLICRFFGFSAITGKKGEPKLATCDIIKKEFSDIYLNAVKAINEGLYVPLMKNYSLRIMAIDFQLFNEHLPIHQAISEAIDYVELNTTYNNLK